MDKTAADLDVTDKQLFDLVSRSVEDGVNAVRELEKRGKYIPTYTHFPELAYSRRGFPQITNKLFSKVKQYSLALPLGPTNSSDISLSEFPSFVDLVVYANSNQLIRDYYLRGLDLKGYTQEQEHKRIKLGISFFLTDLLERYLYVVEEAGSFSKDKLLPIYLELERGIFSEKLPVEAVVPIALTKFEVDYFEINDRTALERMDDGFQKARFLNEYEAVGIHESVLGASTHALVLKEWELPYNPCFFEDFGETYIADYPVDFVDKFFTALRLSTNMQTGYAQIIWRPLGWVKHFKADLPYLCRGPIIRKYPSINTLATQAARMAPILGMSVRICRIKMASGFCGKSFNVSRAYFSALKWALRSSTLLSAWHCSSRLMSTLDRFTMKSDRLAAL